MSRNRNIVAILAGGTGKRVGGEIPKQFLNLGNRMVIERTIDAFEINDNIDEIIVVMHADHLDYMRTIAQKNGWKKLTHIVAGGKERYQSTLAALDCCLEEKLDSNLLIHDAARPMVSQRIINDVASALENYSAVAVGVPSSDTVWQISGDNTIHSIPERASLLLAQTPQAFRLGVIREAYSHAIHSASVPATDDCGIVVRYLPQVAIHTVIGETTNVKITYPEDIKKIESTL